MSVNSLAQPLVEFGGTNALVALEVNFKGDIEQLSDVLATDGAREN